MAGTPGAQRNTGRLAVEEDGVENPASDRLAAVKRQAGAMSISRGGLVCCLGVVLLGGPCGWAGAEKASASTVDPVPMASGTAGSPALRSTPGDSWKRYVSEKGRFSVYLPGTPEESSQEEVFGELGKSRSYTISSFDQNGIYTVTHTVIPSFPANNRAAALAVIEGAAAGISETLKKDGISIRKTSNIDLGKTPGKELQFDTPIGESVVRLHLSGDILYVLVCLTRKDSDASESRRNFLDTFRITEP
jgi:hypothetical protein